jgi:hypothetical protein
MLLHPKRIGNNTISAPIKTFVYFDFKDWLAGLLSHPGFEGRMDNAWKNHVKDGQQKMHEIRMDNARKNCVKDGQQEMRVSEMGMCRCLSQGQNLLVYAMRLIERSGVSY